MKLLTLLGIFTLSAGIGCDSGSPRTSDIPGSDRATEIAKKVESEPAPEYGDAQDEAPRIPLEDAKKAYDKNEAVFVDTRASSFFENEHVKGAINVPSSDFENTYQDVPKDKKIITYCS